MGYYVMKYISESYTLQEEQTIYGQVIKPSEILFRTEYLAIMKEEKNGCRQQHKQNRVSLYTILP